MPTKVLYWGRVVRVRGSTHLHQVLKLRMSGDIPPLTMYGDRSSTVVNVLRYKSEDRLFDPSWYRWIFH